MANSLPVYARCIRAGSTPRSEAANQHLSGIWLEWPISLIRLEDLALTNCILLI